MSIAELARCIKENEFHWKCWKLIARYAEEFREFDDEEKLGEYLGKLGLPEKLVNMIMRIVDMEKRLFCELAVFVNPRVIVVGDGGQYFGGGDYSHKTVMLGNVELETVEIIEYDNGFVRGCYEIARVVKKPATPAIIYHTAWDYIGEQKRFFSNELYVWI